MLEDLAIGVDLVENCICIVFMARGEDDNLPFFSYLL
jgi:hypothetical protein